MKHTIFFLLDFINVFSNILIGQNQSITIDVSNLDRSSFPSKTIYLSVDGRDAFISRK